MYLQLSIAGEYGNKATMIKKLIQEIGANLVSTEGAVAQTVFRARAELTIPRVVAAEQLLDRIFILYFLEGGDTIKVHIEAPTVPETKRQAARIARRTCALFETPTVKTEVKAVIYTTNLQGFDTEIMCGRRIGHGRRFLDAFSEQWLTRVMTPTVVFFLAVTFLPTTTISQSAAVGLGAAVITLIIESALFSMNAEEWKWEEYKSEY